MKVFLDTNVLISAFTSDGLSSTLFDLLLAEHEIVLSPRVLSEFRRITLEKFRADPTEIDLFISDIKKNSLISLPPYDLRVFVRDPDDMEILAAALKCGASYLVTGDKDLLEADAGPAIGILTPRQLFDMLDRERK